MVKYGIQIFARIKPTKKQTGLYEVGEEGGVTMLSFIVPRSEAGGFINNKKENYSFKFNKVFDPVASQDEVFDKVARGVIDNCLDGYNGTIFAYGQTGSGKTFTITGGVEKYSDRGIIPRTVTYLFQQFQKSPGTIFTTHISYLEIYNESGYDLLDPKHELSKLEDLPKVTLMEDSEGSIHMRNLSLHPATNEEEALNCLFLGDTNRMITETPMNMASTRSHCIFTIHITSREPGSDTIRKAKLHLVDLAGSERVGKSGVTGTILNEAKCINVSLHFLEQVIVALAEKSRSHIPYRNSMMTSLLRDSLGGNCMTTMIATCSVERKNIDESISTCRFSQRVALVKNEAIQNDELDPKLMVAHLKQQVQALKDELTLATGEMRTDELTDEEKDRCKRLIEEFIKDASPEARLMVGGDMRMIQFCFELLKLEIVKPSHGRDPEDCAAENRTQSQTPTSNKEVTNIEHEEDRMVSDTELQNLRELLKQRDDEISVLLKMLKQEKRRAANAEATLKQSGVQYSKSASPILGRTSPMQLGPGCSLLGLPSPLYGGTENLESGEPYSQAGWSPREHASQGGRSPRENTTQGGRSPRENTSKGGRSPRENTSQGGRSPREDTSQGERADREEGKGVRLSNSRRTNGAATAQSKDSAEWKAAMKVELSQARQEAFDLFRKNFANMSSVDHHKKVLKAKYAEAKSLGQRVNTIRVTINKLKSKIEKHRISRGVQGLTDGSAPEGPDPTEEDLKSEMEKEKTSFKHQYGKLRELKSEIEHIQHLHEKAKVQVQRDFEQWWDQQTGRDKDTVPSSAKSAWRTPPNSSQQSSENDRPTSSSPSTSRSHSRHSQRIIAARMSGQQSQLGSERPQRTTKSRPTSSHYAMNSLLQSAEQGRVRQQRVVNVGHETSNQTNSSSLQSSLSSPRQAVQKSLPPTYNSGSSGISSWGAGVDGSIYFTSPGQVTDYHQHGGQPDSLPVTDRLAPAGTSSNVLGMVREHDVQSHQTFGKNKVTPSSFHKRSGSKRDNGSSIPLTGDPKADADIIAFYKARQKLIQKGQPSR